MAESSVRTTLVVIYPYKFTDSYYRRYEIEFLSRYCQVVVWEMGAFWHPGFNNAIAAKSAEQTCVRNVYSWAAFVRVFKEIGFRRVKGERVVVLQFSECSSFRSLVCNFLVKLRADNIVNFFNWGVPFENETRLKSRTRDFGSRTLAKLAKLIRFINGHEYSRAYRLVWAQLMHEISHLLGVGPTHKLVAGRTLAELHKLGSPNGRVKVVAGSTWDFSNSIAYKDAGDQPLVAGRYAVLLDGAGPAYPSDAELIGNRPVLTSEKWYPALTAWFDQLERETGVNIVVAGHPKSTFPENPAEFGFRRVYYGCTEQLVKHSEFVITRVSTAVSYAVMYQKPIFCIYNGQMEADPAEFSTFRYQAERLGVKPINLDAPPSSADEYLRVPREAYDQYKQNYLTSLSGPKANYRILAEDIFGFSAAHLD